MNHTSLVMLAAVAERLEGMDIVYVGGSTLPLYLSEHPNISRANYDVDAVAVEAGYSGKILLDEELRKRGLIECVDEDAPVCRWVTPEGVRVDIAFDDSDTLGFSNRWYKAGMASPLAVELRDGLVIQIFSPVLFVASKLDAFLGRGPAFVMESTDLEDVVQMLCFCAGMAESWHAADSDVQDFIRQTLQHVVERVDPSFGIEVMFDGMLGPREKAIPSWKRGMELLKVILG